MSDSPIIAFTDGAAKGNPGPGGWGAIVVTPGNSVQHVTELGGGSPHTTNNRMELSGAIAALRHVAGRSRPRCHLCRLHVRDPGHHPVGVGMAETRVEDGTGRRRAQPRPVGGTVRPRLRARSGRGRLALGARPRGHAGQRAGRPDLGEVRPAAGCGPVRWTARRLPTVDPPTVTRPRRAAEAFRRRDVDP